MSQPEQIPVRLSVAAEKFGVTARALRVEAARGRLAISRVAGKDWVTEAAVLEMFERCRVEPKEPGFTSGPPVRRAEHGIPPSGSSSTDDAKLAQDSTKALIRKLKGILQNTSPKSINRNAENVVSLKSASPT